MEERHPCRGILLWALWWAAATAWFAYCLSILVGSWVPLSSCGAGGATVIATLLLGMLTSALWALRLALQAADCVRRHSGDEFEAMEDDELEDGGVQQFVYTATTLRLMEQICISLQM